jgi:hypothetical protein
MLVIKKKHVGTKMTLMILKNTNVLLLLCQVIRNTLKLLYFSFWHYNLRILTKCYFGVPINDDAMDGQVARMKGFIRNEAPTIKPLVIVNAISAKII